MGRKMKEFLNSNPSLKRLNVNLLHNYFDALVICCKGVHKIMNSAKKVAVVEIVTEKVYVY